MHYRGTYIGLCGIAAHQLVFESLLRRAGAARLRRQVAIFETFRKLHPILKEQHFLNPKEEEDDPYESTQITALIANQHGIFGVYSMREVFEYTQFWAVGYRPRVRARRDARALRAAQDRRSRRRAGVEAGATFDKNSALPMTLYTLKAK